MAAGGCVCMCVCFGCVCGVCIVSVGVGVCTVYNVHPNLILLKFTANATTTY